MGWTDFTDLRFPGFQKHVVTAFVAKVCIICARVSKWRKPKISATARDLLLLPLCMEL